MMSNAGRCFAEALSTRSDFKFSSNCNALQLPQLNSTQVILAGAPSARRERGDSEVKKLTNTSIREYTVPWPSISAPQAMSRLSQIHWSTRLPNHDMFYIHTVLMPFQMPMNSKSPMLLRDGHKRNFLCGPTYGRAFIYLSLVIHNLWCDFA